MKFCKYLILAACCLLIAPTAHGEAMPQYMTADAALNAPQSPRAGATGARGAANQPAAGRTGGAAPSRAAPAANRAVGQRAGAQTRGGESRTVAARPGSPARTTTNRAVTSRVGVMTAAGGGTRVGVTGQPTQATRFGTGNVAQSNLQSRLYVGTVNNLVDPNTGLISADAYSDCLESYYTCMDEICTARNPGQRRCACAGRVKTFANTELQLQAAREDLLKISGDLALFIASKGKAEPIRAAFTLTEAEQVMNCVSWRDLARTSGVTDNAKGQWCASHFVSGTTALGDGTFACPTNWEGPTYCKSAELGLGTNWMDALTGSDSDIISALRSYASEIQNINVITTNNNDLVADSMRTVNQILAQSGMGAIVEFTDTALKDTLANTWGYDLFAYAHNNVCNRVLDACFNGIYEGCGTPKNGAKCANGQSQCPFNYNSVIRTNNTGTANLEFIMPGGYTDSGNAACYGYASTYDNSRGLNMVSSDPYSALRRPIADARRSVLQKYALDANADCDVYGEELRKQVQNVQYQKIAATQALQKKRLDFKVAEDAQIINDFRSARHNFGECLSQLYDCYITNEQSYPGWSTSRIKTYCAQTANVPACYDMMVCGAPNNQLEAVITSPDTTGPCANTDDFATNTCRNLVTMAEVLNAIPNSSTQGASATLREKCLQEMGIQGVRTWTRTPSEETPGW